MQYSRKYTCFNTFFIALRQNQYSSIRRRLRAAHFMTEKYCLEIQILFTISPSDISAQFVAVRKVFKFYKLSWCQSCKYIAEAKGLPSTNNHVMAATSLEMQMVRPRWIPRINLLASHSRITPLIRVQQSRWMH
ncbi:Hypothetical_protein [Hexamita inflata]|uniref:Hypothetical_protein n=1 Tax=Hexamita inflata TaxID=28002 RepID=A0AA86PEP7_9EUKA|nr:Hypothetical protein HINF_LOCUS23648 [Hexamita inflata]